MAQLNKKNGSRVKRIILSAYERFFKTTLFCYYINKSKYQYNEVYPISVASSIEQLSEVCCDEGFRQLAKERFDLGHRLIYCCENATLIGYGWRVNNIQSFYAWEIANDIMFPQPVDVLYDFFVDPSYRKRGIYKSLLHFIINDSSGKSLLAIYADSTNVPSNKAIISCGFHFVTKLKHFSNRINNYKY